MLKRVTFYGAFLCENELPPHLSSILTLAKIQKILLITKYLAFISNRVTRMGRGVIKLYSALPNGEEYLTGYVFAWLLGAG